MPCNMMQGITSGELEAMEANRVAKEATAKANEAIRLVNVLADGLCRTLRALPQETIDKLDPDIRKWFEEHKEHDRREGRHR